MKPSVVLFIISQLITTALFCQTKTAKPNILFIPIDDMRPEAGCYGNKIIHTPNIDRIAANGLVFNRAYCQQAVCNPSRASLMTGLRPDNLKVWDLYTPFRNENPAVTTLPQYFKNNGYTTVGVGKTYHNTYPDSLSWTEELHVDGFPFDPDAIYADEPNLSIIEAKKKKIIETTGKERLDKYGQWYIKANATENGDVPDDSYYDGAQTTLAIEKLRQLQTANKPFFLSVGYYKPHLPFNAPKKYWDLYKDVTIPLAPNQYMPTNAPYYAVSGDVELRFYDDYHDLPTPEQSPLEEKRQQHLLHGYYASISYTDAQIGRLIAELDNLGLADNTIIVLWGDHGWKLGEHNSWAKQTNYEIDTRVPLIISGKNILEKGKTTNALVELVDMYPSLCELAGLPVPKQLQGKSFAPLTINAEKKWKKAAYSQYLMGHFLPKDIGKNDRMGYAVRTDKCRYVEWYTWNNGKKGKLIARELYDDSIDPGENTNLINNKKYKKIAKQSALYLQQEFGK